MTVFDALHRAVDDLADAILEIVILAGALGFTNLARDHLFRGLARRHGRIRTAAVLREISLPTSASESIFLASASVSCVTDSDSLNDRLHTPQAGFTAICVDFGADVVLQAVARARRFLDRLFHRL